MFTGFEVLPPERLREDVEAATLPRNLGALLDAAARRHPDTVALSFFDQGVDITWAGLAARVERAARGLAALGVRHGSHVAVLLPNVPEFPVAWLALARLGAVMTPVNITYTPREVAYVLADAAVEFLVVHASLQARYDAIEPAPLPASNVVVTGGPAPAPRRAFDDLPAGAGPLPVAAVDPDDVVNIQYTSGTTGFPKGCLLSHRYWLSLGYVCTRMWATPVTRIYGGANFYYMLLQRMLVNAAFNGGTLFVPARPSARATMADVRSLRCHNIAVFEAVYKQPPAPDDARNDLRIANIFGLTPAHQDDFQRRFAVAGQEFYGMTETGHISYMPAHEILARTGSGSCGVVAPWREVSLRDDDWREVPAGAEGQLWTRGPGILHGYWNKPEANAASFRDGWFCTGDVARADRDGYLYVVGRTKDMIRRNGENIAAREVEAVMRLLPAVRDAAALGVPDPYCQEEVKVYLELQPGRTPADLPLEQVFAHAAAHLAPFKVPRYVEYRTELPRTRETDRVEKRFLRAEHEDLRTGAFDRRDGAWR